MARKLKLTRMEAEIIVTILEDCDPEEKGYCRLDMAEDIRNVFDMVESDWTKNKRNGYVRFDDLGISPHPIPRK